jgi:hypothetical protein
VYKEFQRILFTKDQKPPLVELMLHSMFVVQDPGNKLEREFNLFMVLFHSTCWRGSLKFTLDMFRPFVDVSLP